jgi:hypothetical protein
VSSAGLVNWEFAFLTPKKQMHWSGVLLIDNSV